MPTYAKILCDITNRFVVQVPGHQPGAVIQGDDLHSLKEDAHDVFNMAKETNNPKLIFSAKMVFERLNRFFEHYYRITNSGETALYEIKDDYSDQSALIAEDDRRTRDTISDVLKDQFPNISITKVDNGLEALHHLMLNPPSFLILNMMMPKLGGAEVLKTMVKKDIKTPVLVISGYYNTKEKVSEATGIPVDDFEHLSKPFVFKQFIEIIDSFLHR